MKDIFKYGYLFKQDYHIKNIQENAELVVYSMVCFFIPFLLGHPQLLVGIVVNASLILAALNLKSFKLLPIIMIPSIGVLTKGLIFGPFTIFLVYMIPFIWIGNAILVYCFKKLNLGLGLNRWFVLFIGSVLKAGFLFGVAYLLVKLSILPAVFLGAMGLLQVYTALLGGVLAFSVQGIKKRVLLVSDKKNP
jgi:hypothetical protein